MCMVTEVLVPCYYGSCVIAKSKEITYRIYESDWFDQSQSYKKAFMIFVERTFRPVTFYAGGLFSLDLPTFLQVILKSIIF